MMMKNPNENKLVCNILVSALFQTVQARNNPLNYFWFVLFEKQLCLKYYKIIHFHSDLSSSSRKKIHAISHFNPRPTGPLDFPPPAGGGGRLNAPMISAPGRRRKKNERWRSKAREKSFQNHFSHFLLRSKLRSPGSKI